MVINLKSYKENKEATRNMEILRTVCVENFPDKTWGYIGVTALLFSQCALVEYMRTEDYKPDLYPALKAILWGFMTEIGEIDKERKDDRHE